MQSLMIVGLQLVLRYAHSLWVTGTTIQTQNHDKKFASDVKNTFAWKGNPNSNEKGIHSSSTIKM